MFHAECKDKKAKLILHIPRKNERRNRGIATHINTGTRWGEQSASHRSCLTRRKRTPGTYWIVDWVGPRAGLDGKENPLSALRIKPQLFQPYSKMYWLHHPSNFSCKTYVMKLPLQSEYNWFSALLCKYEMFLLHICFKNKQFKCTCAFWYIFMSFTLQCAC
jgi:hypothetical protein